VYDIYPIGMGGHVILMLFLFLLQKGIFKKSELTISLFGTQNVWKFDVYQQVSKSLDWILESCVNDNEMTQISQIIILIRYIK
jgi:hypothetical protein